MLDSEHLIAAYNTFRKKWNTLPDKECEELFYTKLGIIPIQLSPWEEFKKEHAKLNMTDEELRMIFDFSDVLSYNLTQFVIDIQSKKNELGGKLFAKKYILTSITCESYKYKNNRIITYEIEGPTSANDSRNKTYEYIVEYEVDKVSIGLPLDLDNCSDNCSDSNW